ncbi:uncharacterized protein [Diadema setosum]|uniref:uncharacterized protein n=1 Tax=Diadema setosum TaxID=31175 RepID=UPI003B3B7D3E
METRRILALLGCILFVHIAHAQECAVNQCPNGENCYVRNVDGELPYACECSVPFTQGADCSALSDGQEIFTCYGDSCRSGTFSSVNYPGLYNNRYRALYLLYIPGATSITFTFSPVFDIEEFKDELYVGAGLQYSDSQLDGIGSPPDWYFFEGSVQPDSFTIQGDTAWMYFGTDKNIQRNGFEISWNGLVDTTPPVFVNCPANIVRTVELGTSSTAVSWTVPTATDANAFTVVSTSTPGSIFNTGTTTTVTYTATDEFGNVGQCSFTVTVVATDTTPPTILTCPSNIVQSVETGTSGAQVTWTEPTATDLSGVASTTSSVSSGAFFNLGTTTVAYTITDGVGNANTNCVFTVTITAVDTTAPVITVNSGSIVRQVEVGSPGTTVTYTEPTATDNSGTVFLVSRTAQPGDFFPVGSTVVEYVFADPSGNTATGTFTVTVVEVDSTPPTVNVNNGNIVRQVEFGSTGTTVTYTEPTATDNSGTVFLVSRTAQPGDFFPLGSTVVEYVFSDPSGNTATGTFTVTVVEVDTTAPVVTVNNGNIVRQVEVGTPGTTVTYTEPTATDNSGTAFLVSRTAEPGDFFPVGSTVVEYVFSDPAGNTATGTFTVTIVEVDTIAPVVTVNNGNIVRQVEVGTPGTTVTYTEPTATDNSGTSFLVSRTAEPGDFFPVGSTVVEYVFSDPAGNTATGTFTVTVVEVDTIAPVVTVNNGNIVRQVEVGTPGTTVTYTEPTATDNSGTSFLVSRTAEPGDFFPVGSTVVEYVFSDPAGNTATGTFTVTVVEVDTIAPVVTVSNGNIVRQVEVGTPGTTVTYTEPTATDNSGTSFLVSRTAESGDFFPVGSTVVEYVFSDPAGNTATGTFTVTVIEVDTIAPVVTVSNGNIVRQVEVGTPGTTVTYTEPTATDNSGTSFLVSRTAEPGDFFPVGSTVVEYVFSDPAGNTATGTFTVTVVEVDTIAPVVTVSDGNIVRQVEVGTPGTTVTYTEPTATDNSGTSFLVSRTAEPGDFFPVGSTVVEYVFSDPAGNTATGTFTVTVVEVDTIAPVVTVNNGNIVRQVEVGTPGTTVTYTEPTATDNSGTSFLVSRTAEPGDFFPVGSTVVEYVFSDPSGNTATGTFTVTVVEVDTIAPVITVNNGNIVRQVEVGTPGTTVTYTEPTATDNSGTSFLVSRTAEPGDFFPVGSTVVEYVFSDPAGNTATGTFTVTVVEVDTIPPVVTVNSSNIVRQTEVGTPGIVVFYVEPTAIDNSGFVTLVNRTAQPGSFFFLGTTVVEYLFSDLSGNTAVGIFTVTVVADLDTTPPVVVTNEDIVLIVETGTTSEAVDFIEPNATDNSGTVFLVSRSARPGDNFSLGVTVVEYVFSDLSGNLANGSFTITILEVDTTPPSVTCVSNVVQTVELGTTGAQVFFTEPTAVDNSGQATLLSRSNAPGDFFPVGTTTVTYLFVDPSGNQAAPCSFTVTVTSVDTTPPTVTCINDIVQTVELGSSGAQVFFTEPSATDLSGQANLITRTAAPGDTFPVGTTTVTYLFADNSGNQAAPCTFTVTVATVDTTPPTVTCTENIVQTVELGTSGVAVFFTEPSATDISGTAILTSRTNSPGDVFPVGTTVVTYVFSDASGNQAAPCVFTVTVTTVDTMNPMVTSCPDNIARSVELGEAGTVITWSPPEVSDIAGIQSVVSNIQSGTFFNVGETVQVSYTVTDNSGLVDNSCSFTVTVFPVDTTPPTVLCVNNIVQTVELGTSGTQVAFTEPTATDISGQTTLVSRTAAPGDFFPVGSTTVTYVFADNSGNTADPCSFTITVTAVDTTPPTVTCTNNIVQTVELGTSSAQVFFTEPSAADISGQVSLLSRTAAPGDSFPVGDTSVTYIFTDNSGNTADPCTFTITVNTIDTTPPTVTCISDITQTVELGTSSVQVFFTEPTASDISGQATLLSRTAGPGDTFPVGATSVTYIFTDNSGNTAAPCTFTVTVNTVDTTPPSVTCVENVVRTVELGTSSVAIFFNEPTATDISGQALLQSRTNAPGDNFPVGTTVVTYVFTDASGNQADPCSFTVTVTTVDTTDPTVTDCPSNIVQSVELGVPGAIITWTPPTATDLSGIATIVSSSDSGSFFNVGQTVDVTYTVTDNSGNSDSSCTFTVTVFSVDTTPPTVSCVENIVQTVELGTSSVQISYPEPTASDISGTATLVSRTNSPGEQFPVGTTTVTYIFADASGNQADPCTFTITIVEVDTTPPTVTCQSDLVRTIELGTSGVAVFYTEPTATDISGQVNLVSQTSSSGDFFPVGVTSVTYVFSDNSGNTADPCTFTVTVNTVDTTPPSVTCIEDIVRTVELGTTSVVVFYSEPSATDISGQAILQSRSNAPGDNFPVGTTFVTYIFADASGNEAAPCVFTVTVATTDTTPPTVSNCPTNIAQSVELGTQGAVINWTPPTAMDLSGIASIVANVAPGSFFDVGQTTLITYTVTDNSGLTDSSCTFTVSVFAVDTTPPTVTCVMNIVQSVELGTQSTPITWTEPTATDISGVTILRSQTHTSGSLFPVGTTTVTYIFTDGSDNDAAPCTFTITVVADDTTHPTVLCTNDVTRTVELGTAGVEVAYTEPSATDISGTEQVISQSHSSGDFFSVGATTVTYVFADASGNVAPTCSFVITVNTVDTTPPDVQNCPSNIVTTIELGTASAQVTWVEPTATDISGTATVQSQTRQPGDSFDASTTTTIVYLFTDASGNVAAPCSFTVTVNTIDTTPPTVSNCPQDIVRTIEVNSATRLAITWSVPTATDISGTQFISSQSAASGDLFPVGSTTTVTYIFSDASGNDADPCVFNVIILTEDTTPPVISGCPADITQTTPLNSGGVVISWVAPTAIDNSNNQPSVTVTRSPNTFFPTGATVVTYTFSDEASNTATCAFTVTVIEVDTENPVITNCPNDIRVNTPLGTALTPVSWPALIVTDNSGQPALLSQTAASGDSFSPGRTTVTIVYTDPSSNTATCQFVVTVTEIDTIPPEILSCPSDITSSVPVEVAGTTVTWTTPVVTDNSNVAPTVTSNISPGSFFLRGSTQVTYTFTDGSGNQVTCSFVVTVVTVDEVGPVVTCPENIVVTVLEGVDAAFVDFDPPTVTDNAGATNLVASSAQSGDSFPVGTSAVIFEYADTAGNTGSCSFTITVLTDTPCAPNPCLNGGACVVNSLTEYQCVCAECFTGTNCETQLNACDNNLCQNGGACVAYPGSCDNYYCECPACFVGTFCDIPVDACDNNQCQNGAACVVDADSCLTYTCSCPLCYTGQFCQTKLDACSNHQCQNGAACEPVGDLCTEYTCQCSGCFTGDLCDEVRDACSPNPCLNGAQCTTLGDTCFSYSCECSGCFTGFNCEQAIPSPCDNNPCQNGGVCSTIAGVCSGYQCACPDGFAGVNCEQVSVINTNPCNNFPCQNGGTCVNEDSDSYLCLCRDGFTGINCQLSTLTAPGLDSCSASPCLNGADCVNSYDSDNPTPGTFNLQYACICQQGFTGVNCGSTTTDQPVLDICTLEATSNGVACENGGICRNLYESLSGDVDFYCDCPLGWEGHNCETPSTNPCASAPCQNGGVCTPDNNFFTCDCPTGFSGTTCEIAFGDNDPPTINDCPEDIVLTVSSGSGATASWVEPTATDAGTVQRLLRSHVPGSFFPLGDTAVTYVFTDNSANLARCEFFVTVALEETDSIPPVIENCPNTIVVSAGETGTTATATWTEPTATDNSGTVSVSNNYNPGQSFPVGDTTVVYTFTDDAGNQNTCTFSVTVFREIVNQSPTITFCPAGPLSYSTVGASEVVVNFPVPTATDDSGITPTVSSNFSPGQSYAVGTYVVTYTFTDNTGLTSECTFTVQVVAGGDITPPTISDCPDMAITAVAPAGASGTTVTWTVPTATDDSGSVTTSSSAAPGSFFAVGTTAVTYTFTDSSGNSAQCVFNVIITETSIVETPAPTNLALTPSTDSIVATWTPPVGSFNGYQITVGSAASPNLLTQALPASASSYTIPNLSPSTAYVVSIAATGNAGLSSSISGTATTSAETGQAPASVSNVALTPSSNAITVSFTAPSGDVSGYNVGAGTTTAANQQTATLAGDATSYTFSGLAPSTLYFVTVQAFNSFGSSPATLDSANTLDMVVAAGPVIDNCPVAIPASLPFGTYAYVTWNEPTATSSLGPVTTVTSPGYTAAYFRLGTYTFTYEYADVNGDTSECTFDIVVTDGSDTDAPVVSGCPSDVSVSISDGSSSAAASWVEPTATDASQPITVRNNYSPGDTFPVGTTAVTYTFIDAAGYYSTCSFNVVVSSDGVVTDNVSPVFDDCPSSQVIVVEASASSASAVWQVPTATDNSGSVNVQVSPDQSVFPVGTTTVTYTATDPSGNAATCSFDISVVRDTEAPVFANCPSDQTVVVGFGATSGTATWTAPTATDNYGTVSIASNFNSGDAFPLGDTAVTYTATDSYGNSATCSFVVSVSATGDSTPPVFANCPADVSVQVTTGVTEALVSWTAPTATDNSGVVTVTSTRSPGDAFSVGTTQVVYTATDGSGNQDVCSFFVTVSVVAPVDVTPPVLSNCPTDIVQTAASGSSFAVVTWVPPTATDNVGTPTVSSNFPSGSSFPVGNTLVTYTAVDAAGNTAECSFNILVQPSSTNTAPVVTFCPTDGQVYFTAPAGDSIAVNYNPPTATDDSGSFSTSSTNQPGDVFAVGTHTISYTFTDEEGLSATCAFTISVQVGANPCSSNPCSPSEQCFYIPSQYLCIASRRRRDTEFLDLSDICPCENGGMCLLDDTTATASCRCPAGFYGNLCENETVNVHQPEVHGKNELQAWSSGNSALFYSVIICMSVMLVVILTLSGLLCYIVPRFAAIPRRRTKMDEIPVLH